MSQENVEIVRRSFEAFNRDGAEGVISSGLWAPDFVWDASAMRVPGIGVYRGFDEIRKGYDAWFSAFPFEDWEVEVEELVDAGDIVVAISRQRGRGANSRAEIELEIGLVVTLRDGQAIHLEVYLDRRQALEAAGLSA